MTGKDRSVSDHLIWFNPLIRTTLRHGIDIEEDVVGAIQERMELEIRQQVNRDPSISRERLGGSLHTRLRELMAVSGSIQDKEDSAGDSGATPEMIATPDDPHEVIEDIQARVSVRAETIRRSLTDLEETSREILRLRLKKGMSDSQMSRRLGLSVEAVSRHTKQALLQLLDAYLAIDQADEPSPAPAVCCQDFWQTPFVDYARGRLDPDTTNILENQAFRCRRCGGTVVVLHTIIEVFRTGEGAAGGGIRKTGADRAVERESSSRSHLKMAGGIFAAILVGVLVALFVKSSVGREDMTNSSKEITVLRPVPINSEFTIPTDSPYGADYERAVTAYEKGQYSVALGRWERLYTAGVQIPNLSLYLGVTQLLAGKVKEAAQTLVRHVPPSPDGIPYHFYRAQALLIMGRVEEAREELRVVLAGGDSPYRDDAERQLTTLFTPRPVR